MKLIYNKQYDNRPIGVFDSGLGGLTVVKQIKDLLPHENIVYLGDTARVPYGTRSKQTVTQFAFDDVDFLLKKDVKVVVIACNTASAYAATELKRKLSIPVFEVISGASNKAVEISKNKVIGVVGTRGTIGSGAYEKSILKIDKNVKVFSVACPLFVPFIEEGEADNKALEIVAKKYLEVFRSSEIDTLVLGCTHYPIIKNLISKVLEKENLTLVDPGVVEAINVLNFLRKNHMTNNQKNTGKIDYYVTDLTQRFKKVAEMFLGAKILGSLKKVSL